MRHALPGLLMLCLGGCVRVYHPLEGLHGPIIVEQTDSNFPDTHLDLHCVPGDLVDRQQAGSLCSKVQLLFENQGATVNTHIAEGRQDPSFDPRGASDRPIQLSMSVRSRETHAANHPLSWGLCAITFTLVPGVTEHSYAQDIEIRDASGFLLVSRTLEGRLVERFGAGTWVGHKLMDWLWRDEDEKVTGDATRAELSHDLYAQLSQLVFNARMHAQLLRPPTADADPVAP